MMNLWKKAHGWKLPFIALLGLIFALFIVVTKKPAPALEPLTQPPTSPYMESISGIGIIEPSSEVISIGTELPGVVRKVHVTVGQKVKINEPLFTLDERESDAQIQTLRATLETVKVQALDANAQFSLVKDITDTRAVAKDDYNKRNYAAQLAQARVIETQAQLEQALTTKNRLTVKAPIDGEILYINVRPGEFASNGNMEDPLIRMGETNTLHVRVEIDEENASHITQNTPANGTMRGNTSLSIPLKFVRFEPYVTPKKNLVITGQRVDTRVLQVIYALTPTDKKPFVGEQMDVYIKSQSKGNK